MALPEGNLNLQQVVRDLEKRIEALEPPQVTETNDAGSETTEEGASEPAKAD